MEETRIARLKRNIKHYTPEIIVITSVVAGIAALVYIYKSESESWIKQTDTMMDLTGGDAVRIQPSNSEYDYHVQRTLKD